MSRSIFADAFSNTVNPQKIDTFTPLGYIPTERQRVFHDASQQRIDAILAGGAAGGGKAQTLVHEVPTPRGWIPFGELHPGDTLFGRDGSIQTVVAETPIRLMDAYRITFDDGANVVCNATHLWLTFDNKERAQLLRSSPEWRAKRRASRKTKGPGGKRSEVFSAALAERNRQRALNHVSAQPVGTVRTTQEIVNTLYFRGDHTNHAVPVCTPVYGCDVALRIDPYVLGVWLGDGFAQSGNICGEDDEVFANVATAGYLPAHEMRPQPQNPDYRVVRFENLYADLKALRLLCNKHIPQEYLWASQQQRLALIQGLMDTDGCCNLDGGCEFTNTNKDIVYDLAQLIRSMGIKCSEPYEARATLYGKDCGPKWKIQFTTKIRVFRLQRKIDRLPVQTRPTQQFRYIVSCDRVAPVPMKCITVSNRDGLYLTGEHFIPTHNSTALLMEAIFCAVNYPSMRIGCFRRTYPELEESFLAPLASRWGYAQAVGGRWNQTDKQLKFPNGSVINFSYAENEKDASRILGGEYQLFCVDEAGQTPERVLQQIEERLRSGRRDLPVIGWRGASNPGGVSHTYLRKRFVLPTTNGTLNPIIDSNHRTVAFIPAKVDDNPHLDAKYKSVLDAIPDPIRRRQMRDGDWNVAAGAFFEQWNTDLHVVESFELDIHWRRYCGIDYGIRDPWAVIWSAVDPDGRVWCYREIYKSGIDVKSQGEFILAAEKNAGESEVVRFADPSIWGNTGTNLSIADYYGMVGCGLGKADNSRPTGWTRVHHYLNMHSPACAIHAAAGFTECPLLHVFGDRCPMFIETGPSLPRTDLKTDDAKTKNVADHMPDALRYMLSGVGTTGAPIIFDDRSETPQIDPVLSAYPSEVELPRPVGRFSGNLSLGPI